MLNVCDCRERELMSLFCVRQAYYMREKAITIRKSIRGLYAVPPQINNFNVVMYFVCVLFIFLVGFAYYIWECYFGTN